MGLYNVVKPCVVGELHYVRPTKQPIQVDDEVAAPLVKGGELEPYPAVVHHPKDWSEVDPEVPLSGPYAEPEAAEPPPRPRRRRTED